MGQKLLSSEDNSWWFQNEQWVTDYKGGHEEVEQCWWAGEGDRGQAEGDVVVCWRRWVFVCSKGIDGDEDCAGNWLQFFAIVYNLQILQLNWTHLNININQVYLRSWTIVWDSRVSWKRLSWLRFCTKRPLTLNCEMFLSLSDSPQTFNFRQAEKSSFCSLFMTYEWFCNTMFTPDQISNIYCPFTTKYQALPPLITQYHLASANIATSL